MNKYGENIGSLRKELLKKKKKKSLPWASRALLVDWWTKHYKWPYPTEKEKVDLAALTGLERKQVNNWFVNQRKRHWRPSKDMSSTLVERVMGGSCSSAAWGL